jgi:hypothetical protein
LAETRKASGESDLLRRRDFLAAKENHTILVMRPVVRGERCIVDRLVNVGR